MSCVRFTRSWRHLTTYVGLVDHSEGTLAASIRTVAQGHDRADDLGDEAAQRYGEDDIEEPERLHAEGLAQARAGEIGLLPDLQDLPVLATLVQTTWTVIVKGAQGLRDRELLQIAKAANSETSRQLTWLKTRMQESALHALIVTPECPPSFSCRGSAYSANGANRMAVANAP